MWDTIAPEAQAARTRQQIYSTPPQSIQAAEPGVFSNFFPTAGNYFMRSMAEAGRAVDMAGAVLPVAYDAVAGGTEQQDRYFREHDAVFNRAVDYWTPKPQEAGAAGQVVGQVGGGLVQFLASPALAVANAHLSTAEELVRQGVDAGAANVAGDIAAVGTVLGMRLPIMGNNLGKRVAVGIVANVAQGAAQAGATHALLGAEGSGASPQVRAQFDPFDFRGRTVDALMGAAFGVAAHVGARGEAMSQTQKDALMLVNQSRHLEEMSMPGRPASEADLTAAVRGTREAIDQMLRGEPVAVDEAARGVNIEADPARAAQHAEAAKVIDTEVPKAQPPIEAPKMLDVEKPLAADGVTPDAQQPARPQFDESVRVPTGEFDPKTGEPLTMSANDYVSRADRLLEHAKTRGVDIMRTAASCLLGAL